MPATDRWQNPAHAAVPSPRGARNAAGSHGITPGAGHELASPAALARALAALGSHEPGDAARLAACRKELDRRLTLRLAQVQSLIDAGKSGAARKLLEETDRQFGGLAAARSLALAATLD